MIPPHLFYQIYLSFLEQNDCTPPKSDELSEYTDSAHTEVEDLSFNVKENLVCCIILDSKLNFLSHIKSLNTKCLKALNIIKCVSGTK